MRLVIVGLLATAPVAHANDHSVPRPSGRGTETPYNDQSVPRPSGRGTETRYNDQGVPRPSARGTETPDHELEVEGRELRGDPNGYVASGASAGADEFRYQGFLAEGGYRLGRTPLFARVMGQVGNLKRLDNPGRGTFYQGRIGGEARTCVGAGMLCLSAGIDVGLHRGRFEWVDVREDLMTLKPNDAPPGSQYAELDSVIVAPRLTADGGGRVRIRAVLERPSHTLAGGKRIDGLAGSLTLGLAF
jgi:hypothetical protein